MEVIFSSVASDDKKYWEKYNPKILQRIEQLINDIKEHPFFGIGKPEPLKFERAGYWSRRINHEHRLVYKVVDDTVYIAQCRYHYSK